MHSQGQDLAIQPDFPAQAVGAQGWALPVILYQAHIVCARVNSQGCQAAQIQLHGVARVWLENDLYIIQRIIVMLTSSAGDAQEVITIGYRCMQLSLYLNLCCTAHQVSDHPRIKIMWPVTAVSHCI